MESLDLDSIITKIFALFGKALIIYICLAIVFFIVKIVTRWKLFGKMGESGWKSIIPIYNTIIVYDCIWDTAVFWFTIFLSFFSGIAAAIIKLFESGTLDQTGRLMGYLLMGCQYYLMGAGAIIFILGLIFNYKYSKAFGHGILFALGLLICPRVFEIILAFGKSEYKGVQ